MDTVDLADLALAQRREAERRSHLLGPLTAPEATDKQLRARSRQTLVPKRVLWSWWQAYREQGIQGLLPQHWTALSPAMQQLIEERRQLLGDLADTETVTHQDIDALAKRTQWSKPTAKRWFQRYRIGGLWGLGPKGQVVPSPKPPEGKSRRLSEMGGLADAALQEVIRKRTILGDELATQAKGSVEQVQARAAQEGVCERTLWGYRRDLSTYGPRGLARLQRSDKGQFHNISPLMVRIVRSIRLTKPGCTVRYALDEAGRLAECLGEFKPTEWQVRTIFSTIPKPLQMVADHCEDAFRNEGKLTHRMVWDTTSVILLLDHVEPLHIYVKDQREERYQSKSGETRPFMTLILDSATRLVPAVRFSYDKPDRYMVGACLRDAFLPSDLIPFVIRPDQIRADRGKVNLSAYVGRFTHGLRIKLVLGRGHHPEARGLLERFNETLNTEELSTLSGYAPPNSDHPHIPATLTLAELEDRVRAFLVRYNHEVHNETKMAPFEFWRTAYTPDKDITERDLDFLLTEPVIQEVQRAGIKHKNRFYWHPAFSRMVGTSVLVRFAPFYDTPPDEVEVFELLHKQYLFTAKASDSPAGRAVTAQEVYAAQHDQRVFLRQEITEAQAVLNTVYQNLAAMHQGEEANDAVPTSRPAARKPRATSHSQQGRKKEADILDDMAKRRKQTAGSSR